MNVAQVPVSFSNDFWPPFDRGENVVAAGLAAAEATGEPPVATEADTFPAVRKCVIPGRGQERTKWTGSVYALLRNSGSSFCARSAGAACMQRGAQR